MVASRSDCFTSVKQRFSMFFQLKRIIGLSVLFVLVFSAPVWAALPYYNQDLGYTIWLGDGWIEAPESLAHFTDYRDGLSAKNFGWQAAYTLGDSSNVSLLVSRLQGKMITRSTIANFNRHVVRELKKLSANPQGWNNKAGICLHKANYDSGKNILRLEMDALGPSGTLMTSVVYIVYTRGAMLKFVGLTEAGDSKGVAAIDAAVSTLYLDHGLNQ